MTTKTVEIPTEAELEAALRSLWEGKEQVEEMMSRLLAIEPTVDDEFIAAVREGREVERVPKLAPQADAR